MLSVSNGLDLAGFKGKDEQFIYGIEGALRLNFIQEALYSFLAGPLLDSYVPSPVNTFAKCIFAFTDKRIILIGKTAEGNIDEEQVFSIKYEELSLQFKKRWGTRLFIIDSLDKQVFNFMDKQIIFEVNPVYYKDADKLQAILSEYMQ